MWDILYRQTGNSASSTSIEATVGRVRSDVSSVLHLLEPGARPQGTATTNVVASTSTYMSLPMRRTPVLTNGRLTMVQVHIAAPSVSHDLG